MQLKSDLIYLDYFVSSNKVGLARYPDNWNYKEQNSFHRKCRQRWWCAVQQNLP